MIKYSIVKIKKCDFVFYFPGTFQRELRRRRKERECQLLGDVIGKKIAPP